MIMKKILLILCLFILNSCATYKKQYRDDKKNFQNLPDKEISAQFYLIGDAGKSTKASEAKGVVAFKKYIERKGSSDKDFLIYLGDNNYPIGMPDKDDPYREKAETNLDVQLKATENFKGRTIFIPGNHDWYSNGIEGLKRQEKYIEDYLGKNSFLPENGCPIEHVDIGEDIVIVMIDTQWYLEDWNKNPGINDKCEIKTRDRFFMEVESRLKKEQNKNVILAMHHPMFTNGVHGGFYHSSKHLYPKQTRIPFPGLASLVTQVRTQGGISPQDRYNKRYNELMDRLETLFIEHSNLIVASGHEHSLQYIESDYIKQIVSGSGTKKTATALGKNGDFSYGIQGFARYIVYTDKSTWVEFYANENGKDELVFRKQIFKPEENFDFSLLGNNFQQFTEASIYTKEETDKSDFFRALWGENYRHLYSKKIRVPVVEIDTLYGGLEVVRKGGGHQTRSIRLKAKNGTEYNMRALRKSATQFLQTSMIKDEYIQDDFKQTKFESLIQDFYTSSHPYAFMTVPTLSRAINVLHTNPKLFYVPKQKALGKYNLNYGDELYMIEERPEENYEGKAVFKYPDDIESTHDIIEKLRDDEKYKIDEKGYIRARLFDMIIGDWDRHQDQWRWAQVDQPNGDKLYRPIPRDRDQVYSNFDGSLLDITRFLFSGSNQLQLYDDNLNKRDIEWLNNAGVKLDRLIVQQSGKEEWLSQAEFIKDNLTDELVEKAFRQVPDEVKDESLETIKSNLKARRDKIENIAERYYAFFSKLVVLSATDKDDFIDIKRLPDSRTSITISRNKDGKRKDTLVNRVFSKDDTKEIWIYALDDKDQINVEGESKNPIQIRIIGGLENDIYNIQNGKKIKIYDYKTEDNKVKNKDKAKVKFTNFYEFNTFNYKKYNTSNTLVAPILGFNPDDGILTGITLSRKSQGFERNPFTTKHDLSFGYFFATNGINLSYDGEFNVAQKLNLKIGATYTSNNFARNFFGFGNETVNNDDELGLDFNRVRTSIYRLKTGIIKRNAYGSEYGANFLVEGIQIQNTPDRFIGDFNSTSSPNIFDRIFFSGIDSHFKYESFDNPINTTRGMLFDTQAGVKYEMDSGNTFAFWNAHLGFHNSLSRNRKLVLKTDLRSQLRFGDDILFYQAASIGGNTGLRGYRLYRFTGQNSLVANADIRYSFDQFKTKLLPLKLGIYGGYDIGRVWIENENSDTWHQSYGGGFWVSSSDKISAMFNLFNGDEGLRFSFGVNVVF